MSEQRDYSHDMPDEISMRLSDAKKLFEAPEIDLEDSSCVCGKYAMAERCDPQCIAEMKEALANDTPRIRYPIRGHHG